MSKNRLITGMAVGALVGGAVALCDSVTRMETKQQLSQMKAIAANSVKNPSKTVSDLKAKVDRCYEMVTEQTDNAINALEQVEESVGKMMGKVKKLRNK